MGLEHIWAQKAEVDLFAAKRNTHCPLWFFLAPHDDPSLEVDALVHMPWPTKLFFLLFHHLVSLLLCWRE